MLFKKLIGSNMSKEILFFLPSLIGGGSERTIVQLANALSKSQDYTVKLVVCSLSGKKSDLVAIVNDGVEIINMDCERVSRSIIPLVRVLKKSDCDFLISTQTHTNVISMIASKLVKKHIKVILREVSTSSINIKLKGLKLKALQNLVRITYKDAYKVVCVSNGVLEDFKSFYEYGYTNVLTIYNPVIDEGYIHLLDEQVEHKFIGANLKIVLGIGRLTEAKNFQLLIQSFNELYKNHPESRLIVLGEGELRPDLEDIISSLNLNEVVDLPGFVINPYAYFKYSELFVLSSNWEGLPGVLIQALASKIKIVSTNCPSGPSEILQDSKYGVLVDCNNIDALFKAMQQSIFSNYIKYDNDDLDKHCQLFEKNQVVANYLEIIEE